MRIDKRAPLLAAAISLLAVLSLPAQQAGTENPRRGESFIYTAGLVQDKIVHMTAPEGQTFAWVSSEVSADGKVVSGRPYSAEAVTRTTQTLADGNRIVRHTNASVYRDSEGRTRREQAVVGAIGPWAAERDPEISVFIHDPVAGTRYILDTKNRTARRSDAMLIKMATEKAELERNLNRKAGVEAIITSSAGISSGGAPGHMITTRDFIQELPPPRKEELGYRQIEGVQAEGTRSIVTIPAGQIGNELPIEIVSERWYSPELEVVVMSRHYDPRVGETIYGLNRISRSEPSRSLFEVPAGYTLLTEGYKIRKPE